MSQIERLVAEREALAERPEEAEAGTTRVREFCEEAIAGFDYLEKVTDPDGSESAKSLLSTLKACRSGYRNVLSLITQPVKEDVPMQSKSIHGKEGK